MKRILTILALSLLFLAGASVQAEQPVSADGMISCDNPYIFDGDTLACGETRIRLYGIDTPEMPDHCPKGKRCVSGDPFAAKAYLKSIITGNVTCRKVDEDRYKRTVALCESNGQDLSCAMLKSGHAVERYGTLSCS